MAARAEGPGRLDGGAAIAEFQRRRRLSRRVGRWTAGMGGGFALGVLVLSQLHGLAEPPWLLFGGMLAALLVFAAGALYAPHLYRCPRCERKVAVPDPSEAGSILLPDPASCPACGAALRGERGPRT